MMELPESVALSKQAEALLRGRVIREVIAAQTPHRFAFFKGDPAGYRAQLEGKAITGALFRGGMLEIGAEDSMIVLSDGATPRYYAAGAELPKAHQLALVFGDGSALVCTTRMYGIYIVCPRGACTEEYYCSSASKPNPMTEGFSYAYFRALCPSGAKLSAKAFLAAEQRIPGIGNGVLQDVLWEAGIDPRYRMDHASEEDFRRLYDALMLVIPRMCAAGGRDTENDLLCVPGGYVTLLSRNTLGTPCPRCGGQIGKANYLGGTVYFCEHCQKRN